MVDPAGGVILLALTVGAATPLPPPTPLPPQFHGVWAERRPDGQVNCLDRDGGVLTVRADSVDGKARPIGVAIINGNENVVRVDFVERRGQSNEYYAMVFRVSADRRMLETRHISFMRVRNYVRC